MTRALSAAEAVGEVVAAIVAVVVVAAGLGPVAVAMPVAGTAGKVVRSFP